MAIRIRIIRACLLRGAVKLPDQVLEVEPLDAADMVSSHRAVLVDPADLAVLYDARKAEAVRYARESKGGNIVGNFTPARR